MRGSTTQYGSTFFLSILSKSHSRPTKIQCEMSKSSFEGSTGFPFYLNLKSRLQSSVKVSMLSHRLTQISRHNICVIKTSSISICTLQYTTVSWRWKEARWKHKVWPNTEISTGWWDKGAKTKWFHIISDFNGQHPNLRLICRKGRHRKYSLADF